MRWFSEPLDEQRRLGLGIQVTMRWFLLAVALFMMLYSPGSGPVALSGILLLIGLVTVENGLISWRLQSGSPISRSLALGAGFIDAATITAAIALADGFRNDAYLFYFPAFLAFGVVFGTRWSLAYLLVTMPAYAIISTTTHDSFDTGSAFDQKRLVIRLATMAVTVLLVNLIVRIERRRREQAVEAEAERGEQLLEVERRSREFEREAAEERHRLSQEIHDGISQRVYMLTLGLETAAELAHREESAPAMQERLGALVHTAKQTLLETRHLLVDLGGVMHHEQDLEPPLRSLAAEFSSVTGVALDVRVDGPARALPPASVREVYRITQEALSNVYRHSGGDRAELVLNYTPEGLTLTVSDNGRGVGSATGGHGIANMKERAERIGGRLTVSDRNGGGTTVELTLPVREARRGTDPSTDR